tara:strand:- start:570 stop:773 length:204 start_codon:yes stop_codon:yes gene_type:complete
MANPFEMRWEHYTRAEDLLKEEYNSMKDRYDTLRESGEDPGDYPLFPSADKIFSLASRMKDFTESKS